MKKLLIIIIFTFLPLFIFAQVKNKVCIIRQNYSEKTIKMLYAFKPRLEKLGVENPEEDIEDFINNGSFGSGFVYVAPDGKNYIITNRHVIRDAETATVIFQEDKTKNENTIKGLKILASDAELDLAILEFPENQKPFTNGFDFYEEELSDGDTVYTAGFPGLIGKPVWQFGTGIITNSSVEVEEMMKPELSTLIQHSAQIDGGNSGGPLLIKTKDGNYKVAGINTWKIQKRQDTNFAIPSQTIKKFISRSLTQAHSKPYAPQAAVLENTTNLQNALNKPGITFEELGNFVSIPFLENEGKAIYDRIIGKCSYENRTTMNSLLQYSPIESVRYAIGWYIYKEYHKGDIKNQTSNYSEKVDKITPVSPPEQIEGTDNWSSRILNGQTKRALLLTWTYLNGKWELLTVKTKNETISDYGPEKEHTINNTNNSKKAPKKTTSIEVPENAMKFGDKYIYLPFNFQIAYGKTLYFSENSPQTLWTNYFDTNIKIKDFLTANITAELVEESVYIIKQSDDKYFPKLRYIEPCAGIRLQLPFCIDNKIKTPYCSLQAGVNLSNFDDLQTQFITKILIGGRFYKLVANNKIGIFTDPNLGFKINFNDSEKNMFFFNFTAGLAF